MTPGQEHPLRPCQCGATNHPHAKGCSAANWSRLPVQFRKRPVVVDAWRVHAPTHTYADLMRVGCPVRLGKLGEGLFITTLEGEMRVRPGDYVIRGVAGEFYPCKADVFEATYEAVGSHG